MLPHPCGRKPCGRKPAPLPARKGRSRARSHRSRSLEVTWLTQDRLWEGTLERRVRLAHARGEDAAAHARRETMRMPEGTVLGRQLPGRVSTAVAQLPV